MNRSRRPPAFLPSGLLLALLAPGGVGAAVPLYTNEDLDRLAPLPVQSAPVAEDSPGDWRFVLDMLDRERKRLDAERTLQLERDLQTLLERSLEENQRQVALYPVGWGGFGAAWELRTRGPVCSRRPGLVRPGFRPSRMTPYRSAAPPPATVPHSAPGR